MAVACLLRFAGDASCCSPPPPPLPSDLRLRPVNSSLRAWLKLGSFMLVLRGSCCLLGHAATLRWELGGWGRQRLGRRYGL
jgi:hypothetical protein